MRNLRLFLFGVVLTLASCQSEEIEEVPPNIVLFLVDESESCGTPISEQMNLLEEVQTLLPETNLMMVSSKADLLNPLPTMWQEVAAAEAEWRDAGSIGEPELPLLFDPSGRVCLSATENVGLDAMRLEIVRQVKAARPNNPMELPEGWYRHDL